MSELMCFYQGTAFKKKEDLKARLALFFAKERVTLKTARANIEPIRFGQNIKKNEWYSDIFGQIYICEFWCRKSLIL